MQTRFEGKVVTTLGGWTFKATFSAFSKGVYENNGIVITPRFPFATEADAETALQEVGKLIMKELINKAGIKNLISKENFGRIKI